MFSILFAAGVFTAAPNVAKTPDPAVIVSKAFAAADAVPIAPYLSYKYSVTLQHGRKTRMYKYQVLERLADHYGRFTSLNTDDTPSQDIHLHKTLVSPAFFLKAVRADTSAGMATRVIASSVVVPYDATVIGTEAAGDCPTAYHVALEPKFDPAKHPLRSLWIDTASGRICRAQEITSLYIIVKEPTLIDMVLDEHDMVKEWSLTGTGHLLFGSYTLTATGIFSDIGEVASAPNALFR